MEPTRTHPHDIAVEAAREFLESDSLAVAGQAAVVSDLLAACEFWRAHSVTLNTVAWQLHEALGLIPEGADSYYGDIVANLPRMCALIRAARAAESRDRNRLARLMGTD
jgi:hypothetical protein